MDNSAACALQPKPRQKGGCRPAGGMGCHSGEGELDSFAKIVADYRRHYDDYVAADRAYFGDHSLSPAEAVRRACRSLQPDGTLHPHQRRLGTARMAEAAAIMAPFAAALMAAKTFAELHRIVELHLSAAGGFGELVIYDIAQRVGWYRELEPEEIYLHRGTRDGARVLVPGVTGRTLARSRLPSEFQALSPAQLEDVLCIYKDDIRRIVVRR